MARRFSAISLVLGLTFIAAFSFSASADQIVDDFTSTSNWTTSEDSLVLNIQTGRVQPGFSTGNWDAGSGVDSVNFYVGDGRHGAFVPSRYDVFGTVTGGNLIVIDTDVWPELQVTDFQLPSGWTLRPTGSQPLVIRSLSSITIGGIIDCSGSNGSAATATVGGAGGTGRCGGKNGGAGGSQSSVAGTDGTDANADITAGRGASQVANQGNGGGGGGGYSIDLAPDNSSNGQGGTVRGAHEEDVSFTTIAGGAGGGGGAYGTAGAQSAGGGGGAGGGVILMYAVQNIDVEAVTGEVRANGGSGGAAFAAGGGSGGGGGGGSILMFAGNKVDFHADVATTRVTATGAVAVTTGFDGGRGAYGRTWLVQAEDLDANNIGEPDGQIDSPASNFPGGLFGLVGKRTDAHTLVSKTFDLNNTRPTFKTLSINATLGGASTAIVEARASDDGFVNQTTDWVLGSNISDLSGYRYVQFRLTIDNDTSTSTTYIDSLTFEYTPTIQTEYDMVSTCGRVGGTPSDPNVWLYAFAVVFMLYGWMRLPLKSKA